MDELLKKIVAEVQDNIIMPGYNDNEIRDVAAFVLTVGFAMLQERSADLVSVKKKVTYPPEKSKVKH